jgi:hypothetical protein
LAGSHLDSQTVSISKEAIHRVEGCIGN